MRQILPIEAIVTTDPAWPRIVDEIRSRLGAPENPLLFPPHFLKSVLPKIGGLTLAVQRGDEVAAYAFLFPRGRQNGRRVYTVRYHPVPGVEEPDFAEVLGQAARSFPELDLIGYDPRLPQAYERTETPPDDRGISYGHPDAEEAKAARKLQRELWEPPSDDGLYPADLYSTTCGAATSLVARKEGQVIGFLFGFYKFGGLPLPRAWSRYEGGLRIESQVAGVEKEYQSSGVGFQLKRLQGERAQREGIAIVNWTVDPLQSRNANLNFQKLRAVAFRFLPGHYDLPSQQNRTRASRLEITWLLPNPGQPDDLEAAQDVAFANKGPSRLPFDGSARRIAIEIPGNWDEIQRDDLTAAWQWRDTTDELLQELIGIQETRYMITGLGKKDDRWYLLARRIGPDFPASDSPV
jgi:predicted GNAT superfamily acetyltransferase